MRTFILFTAAAVLGLLLPAMTLADIPIPGQPFRPRGPVERPPVAEDTSVTKPVVVKREALKHGDVKDARTIKAKIIIPRGLLPDDKAAAAAAAPAPKVGGTTPTGTILAGVALSLAAVSCVFLLRKNKTGRTVAIGVLVIAGGVCAWSVAWANIGPAAFPKRPAAAPDSVILLEVVEEGDSITLVLPK